MTNHSGHTGMKILIISMAGIGDTLLATPLVRELRTNFPDATLEALVLWAGSRDLLETNPRLNAVHQKNFLSCSKREALRFLWSLRRRRFDVSINTHPQSRIHYRVIAGIIGAPVRISHRYECSGLVDRWLVNRTLPQDYERHTIENNLDLLKFLDAQRMISDTAMEVFLTSEDEAWAGRFLEANKLRGRRCLGVHVGSGGTKNLTFKRWPLTHFIELARQLDRTHPNLHLILFGGPDEAADHQRLIRESGATRIVPAKTDNLRQAAALIKCCDAFLSVDTALMHLAAAVKANRQIVIEAPTLNKTNVPHGNRFDLVRNPLVNGRNLDYYRYDGAGIRGTNEHLLDCMKSISVECVHVAVTRALNENV
jgi:heptosyltransferase-2